MVKILTIPEIEKAFGIKVFDKIEKQRNKDRYLDKDGYIYIRINGYIKLEHRHIWELHYGKIPPGMLIHHKNGIKGDNKIENLGCISSKEHSFLTRLPNRKRFFSKITGNVIETIKI